VGRISFLRNGSIDECGPDPAGVKCTNGFGYWIAALSAGMTGDTPWGNPALQRTLILRQFWHAELRRHFLCLLPSLARNPFDEVLENRAECGMRCGGVKLYSFFRRQQWARIRQK
jgi:hypothetical protein